MLTRAELELLVIELDKKLAGLRNDIDWESRRKIYLTEADAILDQAGRSDSWNVFCKIDVVGFKYGVAGPVY